MASGSKNEVQTTPFLSSQAAEFINDLQECNNEYLDEIRQNLADTICNLVCLADGSSDQQIKQVMKGITFLADLREELQVFRAKV